ncbi:MAG: class I tRNA ligase family protein [Oscillospiraceae bacterium]|jgi:methionyl-tRNA synthetase|nr:class I tRNA ligase family protein [Oscillospiraceae bacterium]
MTLAEKRAKRPSFPKRVVVTGGMPYGNKNLHFGHIGGCLVHADAMTRFLRDRLGAENVLFVSGTDCYGSPITETYRQKAANGEFSGSIEDFVRQNHESQKATLDAYGVSPDLFGASALGRAAEIHRELSEWVLRTLHENGHLKKLSSAQFYDPERGVFLNGRQVLGRCPVAGCQSEKGYADECDLGHQYLPSDLIEPKSALTGVTPELREVPNLYIRTDEMRALLKEWLDEFAARERARPFVVSSVAEFLEPPVVYCKRELLDEIAALPLPAYTVRDDGKTSVALVFGTLDEREAACAALSAAGIRFRTGKTLVPFRLTGNAEWGVPAPEIDGLGGLTFWVWPESLWAPISFTKAALEARGGGDWRDWWCSRDAKVIQFIGQDNVYFYGPAQTSLFLGLQGKDPVLPPPDGALPMADMVANNHILFFNKKASSSGKLKPPMAAEMLRYYTPEQLRAHFLGLGLSIRSVGFQPKPFNPDAKESDQDPVLKEGSLFTNVLNRAARSCFYTAQKYFEGKLPPMPVSAEALEEAEEAALDYERLMFRCEFHQMMNLLDAFIRDLNKTFSARMREAGDDPDAIAPALADAFHILRVAAVLSRPAVPFGAAALAGYFALEGDFFSWERLFTPLHELVKPGHVFKFLEPRVDFFAKHESQLG